MTHPTSTDLYTMRDMPPDEIARHFDGARTRSQPSPDVRTQANKQRGIGNVLFILLCVLLCLIVFVALASYGNALEGIRDAVLANAVHIDCPTAGC